NATSPEEKPFAKDKQKEGGQEPQVSQVGDPQGTGVHVTSKARMATSPAGLVPSVGSLRLGDKLRFDDFVDIFVFNNGHFSFYPWGASEFTQVSLSGSWGFAQAVNRQYEFAAGHGDSQDCSEV
ncbi:hypothetical protein P7K49_010659, partial [Saguinus oedipus]